MINILKNLHLKILAFVAALLLWLFVVGVENYVFTSPVEFNVRVLNLGQNVSLANELPKVRVKYKSNSGNININTNELDLFLNAQGLADGTHNLRIEYINKNPQFNLVAIDPANLDLKLEAITSKNIALKVEILGSPDKDYELKATKADAESIKISGAASAIGDFTELPVKISLDGTEKADFSRKITLEPPADWKLSGQSIAFDPATIQVDIEIRKKPAPPTVTDTTPNSPNDTTDVITPIPEGMERKTLMVEIVPGDDLRSSIKELVPKNILVTVESTPANLAELNNNSVKLMMSTSEVQNGAYTVTTKDLVLPEGKDLKVITFSPARVTVKF